MCGVREVREAGQFDRMRHQAVVVIESEAIGVGFTPDDKIGHTYDGRAVPTVALDVIIAVVAYGLPILGVAHPRLAAGTLDSKRKAYQCDFTRTASRPAAESMALPANETEHSGNVARTPCSTQLGDGIDGPRRVRPKERSQAAHVDRSGGTPWVERCRGDIYTL